MYNQTTRCTTQTQLTCRLDFTAICIKNISPSVENPLSSLYGESESDSSASGGARGHVTCVNKQSTERNAMTKGENT